MIAEATSIIAEYAAGLGLEAGKDYFKEKVDEKKLQEALTSYIETQRKYNEICTLAEEFDFQGLVEYINENFLDEVERRFFCLKPKDRGAAHNTIINAAVAYSKADTPEAKANVAKVISTCLDIIRNFYLKKISRKEFIVATEVVDAIVEPLGEQIEDVKNEVLNSIRNGYMYSLEQFVNDAQIGDFKSIDTKLKMIFNNIDNEHPLYPDYGFAYNGGLISKPLTNDATVKYPVRYRFSGRVRAGDKYIDDPSIDPFEYAYRHQLVLTMEVAEAKKYLGEFEEKWFDSSKYIGRELKAHPPEFPAASQCEIKVKDETFFDDVWMRRQEIEDDGTFIFSNHEQLDVPYQFEVRVRFSEEEELTLGPEGNPAIVVKETDFKVHIQKNASNEEYLRFVKFMKAVSEHQDFRILVKEAGAFLVAKKISNVKYTTGFINIDEEIDFLERICDIEKYFGVKFVLEGEIGNDTYNAVIQISELVRNEEISLTWSEAIFTATVDENLRTRLMGSGENLHAISYVGSMTADMLGTKFEFKLMRTFKSVIIKDYERKRQIANLMNDGDLIKIEMMPGEDNRAIDTLKIPEKIDVTGREN